MTGFRHAIEALIRDDGEAGPFPLEPCFRGLSRGLAAAAALKNRLYDRGALTIRRLPCPVISIGNITVGGTGKTPMTVFLARHLKERGLLPLILSRGYGGRASEKGGVVSDGRTVLIDASWAGDEPFMMAEALGDVPVVVGKDRGRMGRKALARFSPDVILLDDGFQHRKLHRDLDILLFDASRPFGNGFLLPRGPLREPVTALSRAHLFVLTRSGHPAANIRDFHSRLEALGLPSSVLRTPIITCDHRPVVRGIVQAGQTHMGPVALPKETVFAFSGIANNDDVRRSLDALGFNVAGFMAFPDHHPYSRDDRAEISRRASACGAAALVTTDKDAARLGPDTPLLLSLFVVGIDLDFTEYDERLIGTIVGEAVKKT